MHDDLLDLFGAVASGFQARLRLQGLAAFERLGLAPFQARALSLIARNPGCSQQALAEWTGRDKAQVARTVKELEIKGFISRQTHKTDWRAQSLCVTAEGERAAQVTNELRARAGAELLAGIGAAEREALHAVLSTMRARLVASGDLPAGTAA